MKRAIVVALFLAACSGASPVVGEREKDAPSATIARADVERDLGLELSREATDPYDDGRDPHFKVFLVNRSKTTSYPIVVSNDGSEAGWREPTIGFTAEKKTAAGNWEAAPKGQVLRCGLYAQDWTRDLRTIAPGERIELPWFYFAPLEDVGDATRVRFVAHYAYGEHARDKSKVPPALHAMPEYAIASAPFEIEVKRPLRLELSLVSKIAMKDHAPLAGTIEVAMVNQSGAAFSFGEFEQGWFEIEMKTDRKEIESFRIDDAETPPPSMAAGARRSLVGPKAKVAYAPSFEPGVHVVEMRAVWIAYEHVGNVSNVRRVSSAWVPVPQGQQ